MALFDRPYTTFYWSAIVNIASVPFLSYLMLNNIVTSKLGLEVTQSHSNWYHSKLECGFLFAFYSNYGSILHHFRDKNETFLENYDAFIPPCIRCPRSGVPVAVLPSRLVWKTRMVGLPDGEKILKICITI